MTDKLRAKGPWWELSPYVRAREPFTTHGSLWAAERVGAHATLSIGHLSEEYRESVEQATYIVYSYGTPIAWFGPSGWTMPDRKYSATTSAHQNKIRTCLS
jgi:hypothetical protein